jgi:transposase InsO family protein
MSQSSKSKVIVLTALQEGVSVGAVAKRFGVSRRWVHILLARYRQGGLEALESRSTAPKSHPHAMSDEVRQEIIRLRSELGRQGLDNGAATIAWHLQEADLQVPAASTIWRILVQAGLVTPQPKKKPKAYIQRFAAHQPNETWQSVFTHWHLEDGSDVEILNWLDDHSRFLLYCTAMKPVRGRDVVASFQACINEYGVPSSTLTDNGVVYTARFVAGRNEFEYLLQRLGIKQKNGHPGHPQTQGKIERFHQTLKRWLVQQPKASTIFELQEQLDRFRQIYNHQRPHKAIGLATPAFAYEATVKAVLHPSTIGGHYRIRFDHVDTFGKVSLRRAGKMHHLGVGRAHRTKKVTLLVDEKLVQVVEDKTGEILTTHRIDGEKTYWAQLPPQG